MDKYYHCPYRIIREAGAEEGNSLKVTNMPEEQQGQYYREHSKDLNPGILDSRF